MYLILLSFFVIIIGCICWYKNESRSFSNPYVIFYILILIFGASIFIINIEELFIKMKPYTFYKQDDSLWNTLFILGLIYIGTVCYTIASYYHLKLEKWSFLQALLIAIPFVLIEYQFSLRGNFYAKKHLMMNAVQITLITMIFYFINSWLLNYFVLKHSVIWWRELLSFLLIFLAFMITTSNHK